MTSSRPMNPIPVYEVMTFLNHRSTIGRVVINPPEKMAPLETHRTGENWYFCYVCGRSTLDQNKHLKHMKEHNGSANIFTYPHITPSSASPVRRRALRHNDRTVNDRDEESEEDAPPLNLYMKKQTESENKISCRVCSETFPRMTALRAHMVDYHADDDEFEQCSYCNQVYRKTHIRTHIKRNHNPENLFKCSYCDTRKATAFGLQQHIALLHPNLFVPQRKNSVKTVQKDAAPASRNPSVSKPKQSKSPVKSSEVSQTKAKEDPGEDDASSESILYRCKTCQKTFLSLASLRKHFRIHTDETKFECRLCSRLFRLKSVRDRHMEVAHSSGPYKCPYCSCRFELPKGIQAHVQMRHADEGSDDPTFHP